MDEQPRDDLIKEAINVIMELNDEQLRELLGKMGYDEWESQRGNDGQKTTHCHTDM